VIVDPLRMFWPEVETANDEAAKMIKELRDVSREVGCAWIITHHRRKPSRMAVVPRLDEDPKGWFREAAGSHAIVNQTDSRIGVVEPSSGRADLLLGGFMRTTGSFTPLNLSRAIDDDGNAIGYRLLAGSEHLGEDQQRVYTSLPQRFRFKDVSASMGGTSDSKVDGFLKKCVSLRIAKKDGRDYVKTVPLVECVEHMEHSDDEAPTTPSTPVH
jgi:hypothetical protein